MNYPSCRKLALKSLPILLLHRSQPLSVNVSFCLFTKYYFLGVLVATLQALEAITSTDLVPEIVKEVMLYLSHQNRYVRMTAMKTLFYLVRKHIVIGFFKFSRALTLNLRIKLLLFGLLYLLLLIRINQFDSAS